MDDLTLSLIIIALLCINLIPIYIMVTKFLSKKEPKGKKKKISEESFNELYDACFAVLKDLIYRREYFNTFIELADHVKDYYLTHISIESYKGIDEEIRDITVFGIVVYIVKEHEFESRLIKKPIANMSIEHRGAGVKEDGSVTIPSEVLSRFGGKVVAHTTDPEEPTIEYIKSTDKPKSVEIKEPKYDKESMIHSINQFYEE